MIKLGERRIESRNTVKKVTKALKDKFGESEDEKFRKKLPKLREIKFSCTSDETLDKIDDIRHKIRGILGFVLEDNTLDKVEKNLEKIFRFLFVEKGILGGKITSEKGILLKAFWKDDKNNDWEMVKEAFKTIAVEEEKRED